ncbi:MAG: hypothetical protein ACXAEF_06920 [Candidatus Thorarchaeota archaeon]
MNWKRIGAWCGILASVQYVTISTTIMLFLYPGGFDFFTDPTSTLGYSVTNGVPTPLNWFMWATATSLHGALQIPFWLSLRTAFTETTPLKKLSWIGTILGVAGTPFWVMVGVFAWDLYPNLHLFAGNATSLFLLYAFIIYSIAIYLNKDYGNVYALVGIVVVIIGFAYVLTPFWYLSEALAKLTHYSGQLYFILQGYGLLTFSRKLKNASE